MQAVKWAAVAKLQGCKTSSFCGKWVVAKLQGDKSASQSSMELYFPWISGPLRCDPSDHLQESLGPLGPKSAVSVRGSPIQRTLRVQFSRLGLCKKTREGCGCFRGLFGGSRGKLRENCWKFLGVQTPSNFQAISGNLLGPSSGNFRRMLGNFGQF